MAYVRSTCVYAWKEQLLGKPCFKPYRLYLYANGRLLLEKQDSEIGKASANLCEIFPYIRIGALDSELKKDRATAEGLTLAYHTLVIPLESAKGPAPRRWREWEFAVSFDREIKEWMEAFAQVLSFRDQLEDVVKKYHERKKCKAFSGNNSVTQGSFEETDVEDPTRLWATARGSGDDYSVIWTSFLEHCSAKVDGVDGECGRVPKSGVCMNMERIPYKGWAQLQPLGDEDETALVPLLFPLDKGGSYAIGSSNSDSVHLLVPETERSDGPPLPVEAFVIITDDGDLLLQRPQGNNANVTVNGEMVENGSVWRSPVQFGATVSFGPWPYLYTKHDGLFDDQTVDKMSAVHRCRVCQTGQEGITILPCGHNICANCRREGMAQPVPSRFVTRQQRANQAHNQQGPGPAPAQQPRQAHLANAFAISMPPMQCVSCRTRVTASAASTTMSSLMMNQIVKLISDVSEMDGTRPLCDGCRNQRGLISSRDYDICETCQQILCPVCVMQWHRQHKLKQRLHRLHDLDEVDQKIAAANGILAVLERQQRETEADEGNAQVSKAGHRQGNAMKSSMHSLGQKLLQCRQQLAAIRTRKRALSHHWDDTSRAMVAQFAQFAEQHRQLQQYIERLRNCDVSLTISSSSDETTADSPSSVVTSSATSSEPPTM